MGLSAASAYPLAAATPTSSAPARPGPAVTAIASMSARVTPASLSARRMVGTIASRCARLATSGTTPPNRACCSTLEASASASRVCPRTMPTPVSSQEVSIPRTRGSSGTAHHHQGVGVAGLVVAAPDPDGLEVVGGVQPLGGSIVDGDLQQHLAPAGLGEQRLQQLPPDPATLGPPVDGDVLHPGLLLVDDRQTRIPGDLVVLLGDQIEVPLGQLVPEHGGRPLLRAEQLLLDRQHLGDVPPAEPRDPHQVST